MSKECRRILFGNQGGFPLAQEDIEFLQDSLLDNLGMLAIATCLGQSSVIFGSAPVHNGSTLNIAGCYVLFDGTVLSCPAQNIAGADAGKFWMVPEPATDTPLQFQDGSVRDTREVRTAKVIYADVQPSGGIRVVDMKVYAQLLTDNLVKPLTNPLVLNASEQAQAIATNAQNIKTNAQAISSIAQTVQTISDTMVKNLATPWKNIILRSGLQAVEGAKYRLNSIGNLEMHISIGTTQYDVFMLNAIGSLQPGDENLYDAFNSISGNIRVSASKHTSPQQFARTIGDIWLDSSNAADKHIYVSAGQDWYANVTGTDRRFGYSGLVTFFRK